MIKHFTLSHVLQLLLFLTTPATLSAQTGVTPPEVLMPYLDPCMIRHDLIRQTTTDSDDKCVDEDYHPVGVYLGYGLFFDINNNLSLLIPELFNINKDAPFVIHKEVDSWLNNSTLYTRTPDKLIMDPSFGFTTHLKILHSDTFLSVRNMLLSNYTVAKSNGNLKMKGPLLSRSFTLTENGFKCNGLFADIYYSKEDNLIELGRVFSAVYEEDRIEIRRRGRLMCTITVAKDHLLIKYRGRRQMVVKKEVDNIYVDEPFVNTSYTLRSPPQ